MSNWHLAVSSGVETLIFFKLYVVTRPSTPFRTLSIIWFERFGSDKKRTILNMFVNMNCWTCIALVLLGQVPKIHIYTVGPLPHIFCYIHSVIRQSISFSVLMYIDATIVFRFMYIFKLKNPAGFRDDFWCLFVSLWIHSADLIMAVALSIFENFQTLSNFVCTGHITGLPNKGNGKIVMFLTVYSVILYFTINMRIYYYKKRFKVSSELNQNQISSKLLDWKNFETHSLSTIATDLLGIGLFITAVACQRKLLAVKPENLNVYPNYLFLFYIDLLSPSLGIILVILSFFRKKALRKDLKENMYSIFLKLQCKANSWIVIWQFVCSFLNNNIEMGRARNINKFEWNFFNLFLMVPVARSWSEKTFCRIRIRMCLFSS